MNVLLFAGAGTSVELGVPAMAGLAAEFKQHSLEWNVEPDLLRRVMGSDLDVEVLIERLDKVCSAREPLATIVASVAEIARLDVIRAEVEWFVQHVCERIVPRDARLMWSSVLMCGDAHDITFVTTNYDRAIELAANTERRWLDDGFSAFEATERAVWQGFKSPRAQRKLIKLHGSTDWFTDQATGHPSKLRHPMPLFGRGTLRLPAGDELGSALVLPSREKLLTRPPYPRLTQAFLNACDGCDMAIFVGASMRDPHVRDAAVTVATSRPVFVVNRQGQTFDIPGALGIPQAASEFLISTLPSALSGVDPVSELNGRPSKSVQNPTGILEYLQIALDAHESANRRCEAIEILDQRAVCLPEHLVQQLLVDENSVVARYALGLVATSNANNHLISYAHKSQHASDALFGEELALLERLVGGNTGPRSEEDTR